ncbi:MAG TPA: ABC transporter ATP-binding protein [Gaiellaceae bacterium]|nr:ABC transporter ATP-binding protein [Gaiellaceae bacterium]
MPGPQPRISIAGVSQRFAAGRRRDPVVALENITLDVHENEFVTLVGRSGCGKSTLLRIVAGLLAPTSGRVTVGGEPVTGPRRDIGFVFQQPALLPWRNVIDNVLLPVEIHRLDRRRYGRRAHDLLELVGLESFAKRSPWELSGGMQQRVALCRALVADPAILLMDEPFAALDALTREDLSLELQRIWNEHRKTIVFVTHSIEEAVLLADRVVVMTPRPGRIARVVPVDLPRPRSLGESRRSEELHRRSAELHDLLFTRDPDVAFEPTVEVA